MYIFFSSFFLPFFYYFILFRTERYHVMSSFYDVNIFWSIASLSKFSKTSGFADQRWAILDESKCENAYYVGDVFFPFPRSS